MGTDNLFHEHKAKKLARQKANRKPYDKVLIVCEGEKTEPNYFRGLTNYYELDSANVKITGDCGSSPMSVVRPARDIYRETIISAATMTATLLNQNEQIRTKSERHLYKLFNFHPLAKDSELSDHAHRRVHLH